MPTYLLVYRLHGPLMLTGPGDRLPALPAPGAVPRGEPLLPRIETLLGALAPIAIRETGREPRDCLEVYDIIAEWLTGGTNDEIRITGPFLRLKTTKSTRVYINVTSHLLEVLEFVNAENQTKKPYVDYVDIALRLDKALREPNPSKRYKMLENVNLKIRKLEDKGVLIPWEAIMQRRQRIALDYSRKSVVHGYLYSESIADYTAIAKVLKEQLSEPPELILLLEGEIRPSLEEEEITLSITPHKTHTTLKIVEKTNITCRQSGLPSRSNYTIVLTPIEYKCTTECITNDVKIIHPTLHTSYKTVIARICRIKEKLLKNNPQKALQPGSVIYSRRNSLSNNMPMQRYNKIVLVKAMDIEILNRIECMLN